MDDELRDVVGYEEYFSVSMCGKIWSKRTKKYLKLNLSRTGYFVLSTRIGGRNGKCCCLKVHRLVAIAWLENTENKPFINHKDGDKKNNHISNLEWCTMSENAKHAADRGLTPINRGEKSGRSNIKDSDAKLILSLYIPGVFGYRRIAKLLNLPENSVKNVTCPSRKAWKHLKTD